MAENKQKIISEIYFDRSGYGSRATTLKDARAKDKTITKDDVELFFKKNVEITPTKLICFSSPRMTLKQSKNSGLGWLP